MIITEPGLYSLADVWSATFQGVRFYYDSSYILDFDKPVVAGEQLVSLELTLADERILVVSGDTEIEARAVVPASELAGNDGSHGAR